MHIQNAFFVAELRRRLQIPEAIGEVRCPQYNGILATFSLYVELCVTGGEKSLRHITVHNTLHRWQDCNPKRTDLASSFRNCLLSLPTKNGVQQIFYFLSELQRCHPYSGHNGSSAAGYRRPSRGYRADRGISLYRHENCSPAYY